MKKSDILNTTIIVLLTVLTVTAQKKSLIKKNEYMIKYAIISQGFPVNPVTPWFLNLQTELNKLEIETSLPQMSEVPSLEKWQNTLSLKIGKNIDKTILIGQSIGCVNVLKYIESNSVTKKIPLVVLVAPPAFNLHYEPLNSFFDKPLDFEKINSKVEKFVIIIAKNDSILKPHPLDHVAVFLEKLKCKIILLSQGGHFGPFDENGGVSIPELVEEIKSNVVK